MARIIGEQDIREMLVGAAFLGAGGGGSLSDGFTMLEDNVKMRGKIEIKLIEPDEIPDGGNAVMIAGMGAPTVLMEKEEKFRYEAGYAFDAMTDLAYFAGKSLDAIIPVEYGAVNFMVPMIACMERGVPLVDADGCGRAVPGLDTCLYDIYGIPFCPAVVTGESGDVIVVNTKDAADGKSAENICRYLCAAYGYVVGLGGWITAKEEISKYLVPMSISYAQKVGKAILDAQETKANLVDELMKLGTMRLLAQGKVEKQENVARHGHDIGCTTLAGIDGKKYYADIKNETMVFRTDSEVLLTCPDLICCIDLDTYTPLTNAQVKEGLHVAYFALPAPEAWNRDPAKVENAWKPYFEAVGYEGGMVRY